MPSIIAEEVFNIENAFNPGLILVNKLKHSFDGKFERYFALSTSISGSMSCSNLL